MEQQFINCGPLDKHARFQLDRHNLGFSTEIVLGVVLKNRLGNGDDKIAKSILIKAAEHLICLDKMLSAVIFHEDGNFPHWAVIKGAVNVKESVILFDKCSKKFDNNARRLEHIYDCYSSGQFNLADKSAPLWKLALNRGYDSNEPDTLVVSLSHIVGDGHSARRVLLNALEHIFSQHNYNDEVNSLEFQGQKNELPPTSLETEFDVRPTLLIIIKSIMLSLILSKFIPSWLFQLSPNRKPVYSVGNRLLKDFRPQRELDSRVIVLPSLYAAIKSREIKYPVTVHSVLSRLLNLAHYQTCAHFSDLSSKNDNNSEKALIKTERTGRAATMVFHTGSTVAIANHNKSLVSNFFGHYRCREELGPETVFWDSARKFHRLIRSQEAHKEAITTSSQFDYLGGGTEFASKALNQPAGILQAAISTFLSNLGPFLSDSDKKNTAVSENVTHAFFYHCVAPVALPTCTYAISLDKTSDTVLTFSWRRDTVSKEWVDYFEQALLAATNRIVGRAEKQDMNMTFASFIS